MDQKKQSSYFRIHLLIFDTECYCQTPAVSIWSSFC